MSSVTFHAIDVNPRLKNKQHLKVFIKKLFMLEGKSLSKISFVFCSDDYLLQPNQQFLEHDYFTDILTFDLSNSDDGIESEIYISINRVKENALANKVTYDNELHRIIFHGTLHLCGFGDKNQQEKDLMTAKENQYLSLYNQFHNDQVLRETK